mgnify:CR=1 FL=1
MKLHREFGAILLATLFLGLGSCTKSSTVDGPSSLPDPETPPSKAEYPELISPAEKTDVLSGKEYIGADGAVHVGVTPLLAQWDLRTPFAGRAVVEGLTNLPQPLKLCAGTAVAGIQGVAKCLDVIHSSQIYRDVGATPLSILDESQIFAGTDLPPGYRETPDLTRDNDGASLVNVIAVNRIGFIDCGLQGSLVERQQDCAQKNLNSVWSGLEKSLSGYGQWSLVVRRDLGAEVWRDDLTGLLWSSRVGKENWCVASGNAQANDPNSICNQSAQQPHYPDAQSFCAETNSVSSPLTNENWPSGFYHAAKGGLGKNSSPSVRWRLPTKNDYLLAEAHGIRFVLPDMMAATSSTEWTATPYSFFKTYAWEFTNVSGSFNPSFLRSSKLHIRCVGR